MGISENSNSPGASLIKALARTRLMEPLARLPTKYPILYVAMSDPFQQPVHAGWLSVAGNVPAPHRTGTAAGVHCFISPAHTGRPGQRAHVVLEAQRRWGCPDKPNHPRPRHPNRGPPLAG